MTKVKRGGSAQRGDGRRLKVRVRDARKRSLSSQKWLERQLNDPYVAAARRVGYRSRAAYKLAEMDDRYRILKPGQLVVDLGAAPGGWSQVAAERVKAAEGRGQVIAVDILEVEPIAGVGFLRIDFLEEGAPSKLRTLLEGALADVVLSDMASPATGHARTDHLRIMALAEAAAEFAGEVLAPGGCFVCKVLQGGTERQLLDRLKRDFASVRHAKPPASRKESAELYVLATGFRGSRGPKVQSAP
jgi:23S rRNA (uridine2552-2'-O)-methyltransferase